MLRAGKICRWWTACCFMLLICIDACGAQSKEVKFDKIELESGESLVAQGLLPIPPRLQWSNDHGYCGETSLQSIALYYGVWLSQKVVRQAGGGELLLGHNAEKAISALHFQLESWLSPQKEANFERFMVWLKGHLLSGFPAIITVYLHGVGHDDDSYDHIVPAIGIKPHGARTPEFDREDVLVFNNNFTPKPILRSFGSLGMTRETCLSNLDDGGCIPPHEIYALVIKGVIDRDGTSLPIQMSVNTWDEPNVSAGGIHKPMLATLHVSGLTKGRAYALLKYHDPSHVPLAGGAEEFLASKYDGRHDFTADDGKFVYHDPHPFYSDGVLYYRCVALP